MAFNTGNSLGSTDARDLYDNAQNLDNATNGTDNNWIDRLGVQRKTMTGLLSAMNEHFQTFLLSAGYEDLGEYAADIIITARNQIFVHESEFYRAAPITVLPYTLTGSWSEDAGYFIPIGDASLRQELAGMFIHPHYFVDSANGSDANDGLSPASAYQTIAMLMSQSMPVHTVISLARGSHWREELKNLTTDHITITAYGAGKLPTLDAADVAANGSFSAAGGYTNLYSLTEAWDHEFSQTNAKISVWEDGTRLVRATSVANADATPGSFYAAAPAVGVAAVVYIHATASGNVITNGKTYEITRRMTGLWLGDNASVYNVHTKYNGFNDGSTVVSRGAFLKGCLFEDGSQHNMLIASGVVEDCIAWKNEVILAAGNTTLFVAYYPTGGLSTTFRRCKAIGSSTVLGGATTGGTVGFYGHTDNTNDPHVSLIYEDCEILNLYQGFGGVANDIIISGGRGARTITHIMAVALVNEQIIDYHADGFDNSVPLVNILAGTSPVTVIRGMKAWVKDPNVALVYQNGDMSIEKSVFVLGDGPSTYDSIIRLDTGVLSKFNNNIVSGGYKVYELAAGVTVTEADNNVCYNQAWFAIDGSLFTSLGGLHGTYPDIEANTVTTDPLFAGDPRQGNFSLLPASPAWALVAGVDMNPDFDKIYEYYGQM